MSHLIEFLESAAGNLTGLSQEDYARAVAVLDIPAELREALIARDADAINRIVDAGVPMMMSLAPAEDQPNNDKSPTDKDEDDRKPEDA